MCEIGQIIDEGDRQPVVPDWLPVKKPVLIPQQQTPEPAEVPERLPEYAG